MKKIEIICRNVSQALSMIDAYPIASVKWTLIPPNFTYNTSNHYSIFISFNSNTFAFDGGSNEMTNILLYIPLYEKVVQKLLKTNDGVIKERLVTMATTTKHKKLVKYVWKYTDVATQNIIMSDILGGK